MASQYSVSSDWRALKENNQLIPFSCSLNSDAGRDQLRGNATQEGGISFQGYTFETTSKNITGLLECQ